ncbi:MAG: hypothetical protein ACK56F_30610, partial [bacterium]
PLPRPSLWRWPWCLWWPHSNRSGCRRVCLVRRQDKRPHPLRPHLDAMPWPARRFCHMPMQPPGPLRPW